MVKTSESRSLGRNELGNKSSDLQNPDGLLQSFCTEIQNFSQHCHGRERVRNRS